MKIAFPSLDSVPEPLRDKAVQSQDGKTYQLDLDDATPIGYKAEDDVARDLGKLAEFRENNRSLNAALEQLKADVKRFDGIDPEEYKELKAKAQDLEKKGVKGSEDLLALIEQANKPLRDELAKLSGELQERDKREAGHKADLARRDFSDEVTKLAIEAGVHKSAIDDVRRRALETYRLVDGKWVAMDGSTPLLTSSGDPLSPSGWLERLTKTAPHLFQPNEGGGAPGASPGGEKFTGKTLPADWDQTPEGQDFFLKNLKEIQTGKIQSAEE
jgi:hypothetical protein